mmetsp:Transcript_3899/g.5912  ORF Transcript_3899/g.5912 Transcript_3899/m.5912 type:complete len:114 (+) Transcript_3899:42-383(+)
MLGALVLFLVELLFLVVYPFYMTLRTLEKSHTNFGELYTSWTFYWVMFSILSAVEWYVGFYFIRLLRIVALGVLALPKLDASSKVFALVNEQGLAKIRDLSASLKSMAKDKLA